MAGIKELVFVLDVDGTLTDGKMYYTKEGKVMKSFGCDDFDALRVLSQKVQLQFITADKKGFDIVKKRAEEMQIHLELVSNKPKERWAWIKQTFPDRPVIYMGDGIFDFFCLEQADLSFTVKDALPHTKQMADIVIDRRGGDRAVAEAVIKIDELYGLRLFKEDNLG
jgi:3-deoxy-D-manno-octulosonate 8-phosphate phosphatase (KDO 8-P phosphatase)